MSVSLVFTLMLVQESPHLAKYDIHSGCRVAPAIVCWVEECVSERQKVEVEPPAARVGPGSLSGLEQEGCLRLQVAWEGFLEEETWV